MGPEPMIRILLISVLLGIERPSSIFFLILYYTSNRKKDKQFSLGSIKYFSQIVKNEPQNFLSKSRFDFHCNSVFSVLE